MRKRRTEGKQEEANERENALALEEEAEEEEWGEGGLEGARREDDRWERGVRSGAEEPSGTRNQADDEQLGRLRGK